MLAIFSYLYEEGALPAPDCADLDDYELISARDVVRLAWHVLTSSAGPDCDLAHGKLISQPSTTYRVSYGDIFPAGATSHTIAIKLLAGDQVQAATLPLLIRVDGAVPTIGNVTVFGGDYWELRAALVNGTGCPPGSLLLGFVSEWAPAQPSTYQLATVQLIMPYSSQARPISITWEDLPPVYSSELLNYPMVLNLNLDAWQPELLNTVSAGTATISGTTFVDMDGDCFQDVSEAGLQGWLIRVMPGDYAAITDASGNYAINSLPTGNYTLSEVPKPGWSQTCPVGPGTYSITLSNPTDVSSGNDFGNQALTNSPDLKATVGGTPARPGLGKILTVCYSNIGMAMANGVVVTLTLPSGVTFDSSTGGGIHDGGANTVTWNVGTLEPSIFDGPTPYHRVYISIPAATPEGTQLVSTVGITPTAGDLNPADNTYSETELVVPLPDPNQKLVRPFGVGLEKWVLRTDTLWYHIDFQNTGTAGAATVIIRDTLDFDLDIATVVSGAASHAHDFTINGRELSWTFSNLNLPDSASNEPESHGFIEYRVMPSVSAPGGTFLLNDCAIYFDLNPPVITNRLRNRICPIEVPGDVNMNALVNSADIIYLVNYVFKSGPAPLPSNEVGDINCQSLVTSADIIGLVNFVFKSGTPPCNPCS